MPDPEKLLNTIRRAIDQTQATPGRVGRIVHIPADDEVMIAGDLHGNIANFQLLMKAADLANHPRRHLVVQELIHGTFRYADGSEKSHQAVDLWCALKCQFPTRVHYLPGNHELAQWTNRAISKNDIDLNANFLDGVRTAYGRRGDEIYQTYLYLFASLPLVIRTSNRVLLTHTLPSPAGLPKFSSAKLERGTYQPIDLQPGGMVYTMLWGRDVSQINVETFLAKADADWLITGHIPSEEGFIVPNNRQIILDSLGTPAAYCLFPSGTPVTHAELVERVKILQ